MHEGYSGEIIYLLSNLTCILLTLPIFYQLSSFIGNDHEKTSLKMMLWSFIVYVLSDGFFVCYNWNGGTIPIWMMSLNTMINQLSLLSVSYCWILYGLIKLEFDSKKRIGLYRLRIGVTLFVALLILFSPIFGFTYFYTTNGVYVRGPFFFLMVLIIFAFLIFVPILAIYRSKTVKSLTSKNIAKSLSYFALVPCLAGLLQIFDPHTPGLCLGFIVGLYFVYIDMLGGQIYTDSMTGLNNRKKAEHYISDLIQVTDQNHAFYYFELDVDYFKRINDQFGHLEGDRAIRLVANAIKKTVGKINGFAARVGGDEFCIIVFENHLKNPEQLMALLYENLHQIIMTQHIPYNMGISVGYTKCNRSNVTIEDLSAEADKKLYVNKEEHHKNMNENS